MLELCNVSRTYCGPGGEVMALRSVCVQVERGQFVAIQGPSGCGKTTLLLTAGGLLVPQRGRVCVDGTSIYDLSGETRAALRAQAIGFVFQQFHLVPYLSVLDNVLAPSLARPVEDARRRAAELVEQFGLGPRKDHYPGQLSTGERQRTALARAMMNRPGIILADEPVGNLDPANAQIVLGALEAFARAGGAVLMVSHDSHAAAKADSVLRMTEGRLGCDLQVEVAAE
jgi:putative ABC transport system ATP-binding protein